VSFLHIGIQVKPGGVAVLVSPYSWLEAWTPKSKWLGGYKGKVGGRSTACIIVNAFWRRICVTRYEMWLTLIYTQDCALTSGCLNLSRHTIEVLVPKCLPSCHSMLCHDIITGRSRSTECKRPIWGDDNARLYLGPPGNCTCTTSSFYQILRFNPYGPVPSSIPARFHQMLEGNLLPWPSKNRPKYHTACVMHCEKLRVKFCQNRETLRELRASLNRERKQDSQWLRRWHPYLPTRTASCWRQGAWEQQEGKLNLNADKNQV